MNEWIKQDRNAIQASDTLRNFVSMNDEEIDELDRLCDRFQMKIPQYYLDLINPDDPDDPIRKMCIPSPEEFQIKKGELEDPIGDTNESLNNQPVKAITHRYPDRVLLYPTPLCGGYCRFCFRKRLAGKEEYSLNKSELKAGIDYIRSQPSIKEVILTGGDPLMLGDDKLISILEEVRAIPHIWTIRIHTRMPVWNPYRITHELVEGLAKQHPLWIVTHFNHPRELSPLAEERLAYLIDGGISVLNQAVLLEGVNANSKTLRQLFWKLLKNRVKPYYLHHLDKAQGISHFRTDINKGLNILRDLRGTIPGYAIPHYILDIPGGHGKVPLQYHYLNSDGNGNILVEAPTGSLKMYEDGVEKSQDMLPEIENVRPLEIYPPDVKEQIEELENNTDQESDLDIKKAG